MKARYGVGVDADARALTLSGQVAVSLVAGLVIGGLAGLIGVGGGEYRIPVLVLLLRLPVKIAAGANLVVGLATVVVSVVRRLPQQSLDTEVLRLSVAMGAASVVGGVVGALATKRIATAPLKRFVAAYLVVIGAWMIIEAAAHHEIQGLMPTGTGRWVLAVVAGGLIAAVSSALGVAGGEMRIPTLMYLFNIDLKQAGTASLLVSIPTVLFGAITHRRMGHIPRPALVVALTMGAGSIVGAIGGAALLPHVGESALRAILGLVLIGASVRMAM